MSGFIDGLRAELLQRQSRALLQAGKYAEALPLCQQVVELAPRSASGWNELGWALVDSQRYEDAIAACETAITLAPRFLWAWNMKGVALSRLGRHEEAIAAFDRAIILNNEGIDVGNTSARRNMLYALMNLKRFEDALVVADQITAVAPADGETWAVKADILFTTENYHEAVVAYERAISCRNVPAPMMRPLWNNYGVSLTFVGRYRDALDALYTANTFAPRNAPTLTNLGIVFSRLDRHTEALDLWTAASAADPARIAAKSNMASALVQLERYEEAEAALEAAFALDPDHYSAWATAGMLETRRGRYEEALAAFNRSIAQEPAHAGTYVEFAQLLLALDDPERACQVAERAVALDTYDARAWRVKGLALRAAGKDVEAAAAEAHGRALLAEQEAQVAAYYAAKQRNGG